MVGIISGNITTVGMAINLSPQAVSYEDFFSRQILVGGVKKIRQWPKTGVPGAFLAKNGCT